ncbi:MAG: T9SS type A sorting domain-containing protein [Bacteroidia bacterium]|nr:T9SS type A sorting domain-containing protein [Bacteroidia bacterium]MDW8333577.1 T9SS type A sorting domain-containing protein [Bacteroidia bacterium]
MNKALLFALAVVMATKTVAQSLPPLAAFPPAQAARGETLQIPIVLGSDEVKAAVVFGLGFDVHFDAAKLEFLGFDWSGGFWGVEGLDFSATDVDVSKAEEGLLKLNLPFLGADKSLENVKGVAAVLKLRIKDDASVGQRAQIELKNATLYDDQIYAYALDEHVSEVEIVEASTRSVASTAPRPVIFPNPARAGAEVQILFPSPFKGTVRIFDSNGKILAEYGPLDASRPIARIPLPDNSASGLYLLSLEDGRQTFSYKLYARQP